MIQQHFLMKLIKRCMIFIANIGLTVVSCLVPKTTKIVVIGGWFGNRFADNSKYLFLYLNENKCDLGFDKVVWVTRNKDLMLNLKKRFHATYMLWSIQSVWYHLRAKYHFVDQGPGDINSFFSIRAIRVNMWHGFPLKNIGTFQKDNIHKENKLGKIIRKLTTRGFWGQHMLLATSEFSAKILGEAFDIDRSQIIVSGYPRNYNAFKNNVINHNFENELFIIQKLKNFKGQGYKIIGYFPTFRDHKETLLFGTKDMNKIISFLDLSETSKIKFFGKFHYAEKDNEEGRLFEHQALINVDSDFDIYAILPLVDVLITDYSSIYFDYLLYHKPTIFYPYDLEYYAESDRGLIFNYDEYTPGPKVYTLIELEEILITRYMDIFKGYNQIYKKQSDQLLRKIFDDYEHMDILHLFKQINNINKRMIK